MSNWIGDSGNWSTAGEWDAGVPDSTHDAIFNAGSFSTTGLTVTVDATANCKDMTWTGATNTPTLAGASSISCYGNITTIAAMVISMANNINIYGNCTLTTNGCTTIPFIAFGAGWVGTFNLADNVQFMAARNFILNRAGTFNSNNFSITGTGAFTISSTATIALGSSVLTVGSWSNTGTPTLTANTATINCSGSFAGGGLATYHIVNLTGATSTISGNNTFNTLALPKGTTQTITITDGSTQSAKTFTLSGDAKHTHTITGTAAAGYTLTATGGGTVYMDYVDMSYCTATGATFLYGPHCTMTSCTGWKPAPRYSYFSGGRI